MFYEMRDKRYEAASSGCLGRCWVLVAMCGLLITVSFIGMTLWLGMNSRPDNVPAAAYQPPQQPSAPNAQQPHHRPHHYDAAKTPAAAAPATTVRSTFPTVDYDAMPTTSIKNKKGRIEIVEHEKAPSKAAVEPAAAPPPRLGDGVSPIAAEEQEAAADDASRANGVRKKSEVVYPSWSADLEAGGGGGGVDRAAVAAGGGDDDDDDVDDADGVQEMRVQHGFQPYFAQGGERPQLMPDAQKFNPIPAFSYLKEHPVRLSGKDIRPPGTAESEEYPYFYPQFDDVQAMAAAAAASGNGGKDEPGAANPVFAFLRKRLQDVRDWLAQSGARRNQSQWLQMVDAVNQSLYTRNATIVLSKLRDMYANSTSDVAADTPVASLIYPAAANDSAASLVSFGLLAVDLFLLHNVQQIALNEDAEAGQQMLNDPDVVALNALFLPPDRVKQLRSANSRVLSDDRRDRGGPKGFVSELMEFVNGGLRAVLNLSRAYRSSSRAAKAEGKSVGDGPAAASGSSLDCIWTLYCRNLDKTAKLDGPYGFLAKMNSLGLRLMMGEFPVERALEHLIKESTHGWRRLNCDRLFPRCNGEEAKQVVIETALGQNLSGDSETS